MSLSRWGWAKCGGVRLGVGLAVAAAILLETSVGVATTGTFKDSEPVARRTVQPEGGLGGYADNRVESELSIHVPDAQKEAVWAYLSRVYGRGGAWPAGLRGAPLTARLSDERFIDLYYDTPGLKLLDLNSGVRHRTRDIPGAPEDPKDDRQLIQVKITTNGDTVKRGEYKFPVKRSAKGGADEPGAIVNMIRKKKYREDFAQLMRRFGIEASTLRPMVTLEQHRRRVYVSDGAAPLATITLDEVSTRKWWARAAWTELELELDEVRYTNASAAQRREMETVRAVVRADLLRQFPQLYEDNMPKYTEAFALLEKRLPLLRRVTAMQVTRASVALPLTSASLMLGVALLLSRRRRGGPRPPVRPRRTLTTRPA